MKQYLVHINVLKRRRRDLRESIVILSFAIVLGGLCIAAREQRDYSNAIGGLAIAAVHCAVFYGALYSDMLVLKFGEKAVLASFFFVLGLFLMFPIMVASSTASGYYLKDNQTETPQEVVKANMSELETLYQSFSDKIFVIDENTKEVIIPLFADERKQHPIKYSYHVGLFFGFFYQIAFMFFAAMLFIEWQMMLAIIKYIDWIDYIENNTPIV
ncbi:hypothetical protein CAEBREN_19325 [Caenorhabditis brenneri]|uniref:Uncharacterized protein n=1 Tax=Caenorhabditis brenneri TaxID=135651 RepID=G0NMC8_CAEBE|nr:hypothetical protein CAEBREN_19325 [Caenorhabditis brenneri]